MIVVKYGVCGLVIGLVLNTLTTLIAGAGHGTCTPTVIAFAPIVVLFPDAVFDGGGLSLCTAYAMLIGLGKRSGKGAMILFILAPIHLVALVLTVWLWPSAWDYEYLRETTESYPLPTIGTFAAILLSALLAAYAALKTPNAQDGIPRCRKCSYNLTGNISGVCPECGEEIGQDLPEGPPAG